MVRDGARALFAIVQRSKDDAWVLPRGKLKRDENPATGARREVIEETGHRVKVREYLGAITYRARGRPKVVQFWRMQAEAEASHDLMADISAVEWLPLKAAVRRLSYPLEKLFLRNIGRQAVAHRNQDLAVTARKSSRKEAKKESNKKAGKPARKKSAAKSKAKKPGMKTRAGSPQSNATKAKSRALNGDALNKSSRRTARASRAPSKRSVPIPAVVAQAERAIASMIAKPVTAAKRKSILQRILGRLTG